MQTIRVDTDNDNCVHEYAKYSRTLDFHRGEFITVICHNTWKRGAFYIHLFSDKVDEFFDNHVSGNNNAIFYLEHHNHSLLGCETLVHTEYEFNDTSLPQSVIEQLIQELDEADSPTDADWQFIETVYELHGKLNATLTDDITEDEE